jgi:hypothetical protein
LTPASPATTLPRANRVGCHGYRYHSRQKPVVGWDIDTTVKAEANELIAHVRIVVNGFPECNETVDPRARKWHKQLRQQGQYPGDNKVVVTVSDDHGQDTSNVDQWS